MKTKVLSLDSINEDNFSLQYYLSSNAASSRKTEHIKKVLSAAIRIELTKRQCECIEMYYIKKMKVCDIAKILEIKPTTVYKHLKVGIKSLQKCRAYI